MIVSFRCESAAPCPLHKVLCVVDTRTRPLNAPRQPSLEKLLQELAPRLEAANIRFLLLEGAPEATVPALVAELDAALLVVDQSPLRLGKQWRAAVCAAVSVPVHEVDAHNVVPVRAVS